MTTQTHADPIERTREIFGYMVEREHRSALKTLRRLIEVAEREVRLLEQNHRGDSPELLASLANDYTAETARLIVLRDGQEEVERLSSALAEIGV